MRRLALLVPLVFASPARAELPTFIPSAVAPEPERPFVFAAPHIGLNAPLGLFGLEVGVGYEWFRASVGAGIAFGGFELAATVRAMTRVSSVDVGVGVGMSRGGGLYELDISIGESTGYNSDDDPPGTIQYDHNTLWLNLELVLELPLPGGAFTRLYGGVTSPLYVDCVYEPESGPDEVCDFFQREELRDQRYQPFVGLAAGFRWPQPPRARRLDPRAIVRSTAAGPRLRSVNPRRPISPVQRPISAESSSMRSAGVVKPRVDVVMVQCWLFGLELCAGASFEAFLELLDEEWPDTYRPRATA